MERQVTGAIEKIYRNIIYVSIETLHQKLSYILVSLDKIAWNHCRLFHDTLSQVTFPSPALVDLRIPGSRRHTVAFISN